jgi:transcriptional repressor NrdR
MEEAPLVVVKTRGGREPFERSKVVAGVLAAAKGRPITADDAVALAESVEEELRLAGGGDVPSTRVGVAVLERLRSLDDVAYLRFASVYKNFDAAEDFRREVALLDKSPVGT